MRRVARTNQWHSVEVRTPRAHQDDGGDLEIRLAADQDKRWNSAYLTPKSARKLAAILIETAQRVEKDKRREVKP